MTLSCCLSQVRTSEMLASFLYMSPDKHGIQDGKQRRLSETINCLHQFDDNLLSFSSQTQFSLHSTPPTLSNKQFVCVKCACVWCHGRWLLATAQAPDLQEPLLRPGLSLSLSLFRHESRRRMWRSVLDVLAANADEK
mmetsp:Transcript_5220/g.10296  ORF Transcript_5220/g.10296 Transcript_5220/m.10296 type:complete len:138 (+) Transcript_5220:1440-1853(+)